MAGSVIAAQMYNLREFTKTRDGLVDALKKVADIGYEAVQLSAIGVELPAKEMKTLLDEAGLTVCCTHIPFARIPGSVFRRRNTATDRGMCASLPRSAQ